jgi:hypothetical protein
MMPRAAKMPMKVFLDARKSAMAPSSGLISAAIRLPMATVYPHRASDPSVAMYAMK